MPEIGLALNDALQLAAQQYEAGNLAGAEYLCRQILLLQQEQPDARQLLQKLAADHHRLAQTLANQGKFDEAETEYIQAVRLDPLNPEFQLKFGNFLFARGKVAAALFAYSQTIQQFPNFAPAYAARAAVLGEHHLFDEALADHRKAIVLEPANIRAHLEMAKTWSAIGDVAQAQACCRLALELEPHSTDAWECLGRVLQTNGQFEAAVAAFDHVDQNQVRPAIAMQLGIMGRLAGQADADRLAGMLDDEKLPHGQRVPAGFALGKMLDDADRFDEAFAVYSRANAMFKYFSAGQGHRFDFESLRKTVDRTIDIFSADYFHEHANRGVPSEIPVFIVGMPRSGTTLVEQIISTHSKVFGAGERFDIAMLRSRLASMEHGDSPRHWDRPAVTREARTHLRMLASLGKGAERVIDKMPGNMIDLGTIAVLFPQARIIFCRRDARDICLSCFFQLFTKHNLMFSYDLVDCARQLNENERLTAHWQRVLPLRMLFVQYEELVSAPEAQSRRLIDFLGLSWEDRCLEFHKTQRPILTRSFWQARQPIYTRSVRRWRHYEKHLAPLQNDVLGLNPVIPAS